jgi:glucokinase
VAVNGDREQPGGPSRRIGIDVGGTKCLGVLLDEDGVVVAEERRPTPKETDELVERLVELSELLGPADSIGVGVPGLVTRQGLLRAAPHITKVADLPLRALLAERIGVEVVIDNDATCALLAESIMGNAQGVRDAVLVTLGTGIGGGVLAGGVIQRGCNGFVGEMGHMVVDPEGPDCPCGRRGCWERFASGSALAHFGRVAALAGELPAVLKLAGGDPEAVMGEHVTAAARAGDEAALAILDGFGRWVGIGLVNLTNLLDPELFVLGGGLVELRDLIVEPIRHWLGQLLYAPSLRPHPRLEIALLGERAGAIGAAMLPASVMS